MLLFATYLILIGSILAFAIYEFVSGVAFQVLLLIMGGLGFAFLLAHGFFVLPSAFTSFLNYFSIPLITDLVLVLIYVGTGLKLGLDAKQLRGSGLRIAAGGLAMAVADIVGSAAIFSYVCGILLNWPWVLGALFGALIGDTSAAMIVPYLSHIANLSAERTGKSEHLTKLTSVIKLESTMNSVVLLLFVTIFYNQLYIGNSSPTMSVFFGTTFNSLTAVLANHSVVLLFALAGIPLIAYFSSKSIVLIVKRRLAQKNGTGLEPYAVLYLKNPHPTSTDDVMIHRSSDVTEFSEKQMRMGMMLYGIVLGIALLVFEEVLQLTSFAGFANVLFALIALIYLGFFVGYLFPGGGKTSYESDGSAQGKRTFVGMMLFHDEIELLVRIVFYFSLGIELGTMLFSPPAGLQPIPADQTTGAIELILLMIPIFMGLRYFSGLFGLPIAFYSRRSGERFARDFKLVGATMPKGVTVAALSVLLLQAGVNSGGTIYILALTTVIVSTLAFTFASRAGSAVVKPAPSKGNATALISVSALQITKEISTQNTNEGVEKGHAAWKPDNKAPTVQTASAVTAGAKSPEEVHSAVQNQTMTAGEVSPPPAGEPEPPVNDESNHKDVEPRPIPEREERLRHLEDKLAGLENRLAEMRRAERGTSEENGGNTAEKLAEDAVRPAMAEIALEISGLNSRLELISARIESIAVEASLRNRLKSDIEDLKSEMNLHISGAREEVRRLTEKLALDKRVEKRLETLSRQLSRVISGGADEFEDSGSITQENQSATRAAVLAVPGQAGSAGDVVRLRRIQASGLGQSMHYPASGSSLDGMAGRRTSGRGSTAAAVFSMTIGATLFGSAFMPFVHAGTAGLYILLVAGSMLFATGFALMPRKH